MGFKRKFLITLPVFSVLLFLPRSHESLIQESRPLSIAIPAHRSYNQTIKNFREAKKWARQIHQFRGRTLYCRCSFTGNQINLESCGYKSPGREVLRASQQKKQRLEWEHVVPAEAFGWSFVEWRQSSPLCRTKKGVRYQGRKCAQKNQEFNAMEADLYNLFPEVGEVNRKRSYFSMAEMSPLEKWTGLSFGGCQARVVRAKFEPMDFAKGTVARTYLYMDQAYPHRGILSKKNRRLFEAWDRLHPVELWECELYQKIKSIQKNENPILKSRCR